MRGPSPAEGARTIDTEVRLALPRNLAQGGYLVSYRVVSVDSHPVGGSFAFGVGTGAAPALPPPGAAGGREESWEAAKILLRFVQNIALMLAAGGALFQVLVLRSGDQVPGLKAIIRGGAVVAMLQVVLRALSKNPALGSKYTRPRLAARAGPHQNFPVTAGEIERWPSLMWCPPLSPSAPSWRARSN